MLTQKQIDKRSGHAGTFWKNVVKHANGKWEWTGRTTTNHNTVDCQKYHYGEFELCTRESALRSKPIKAHTSKLAHRIILFLTYGRPVPADCEVFHYDNDHLNINPNNLGVRDTNTRVEMTAAKFFEVANDNDGGLAVAA